MQSRKQLRLEQYDYSENGCYFITVCTKDKQPILGDFIVGASPARPPQIKLSLYGEAVDYAINRIPIVYPTVTIDKYVIMPNHIHMILNLQNSPGRARLAPTVSQIIQQTKGLASKLVGDSIWQRSFYDHIIRSQQDYRTKWNYIDTNPYRWSDDEYYFEF